MENNSSKGIRPEKSKSVRTHITIGNDEIMTTIYEVPEPKRSRAQSVVRSLKEIVHADDCLYFAQSPIRAKENFHLKF